MAFVETKDCPVCEAPTSHTNGKCNICEDRKRRAKLHAWKLMSYDGRLDDLRKRVEALEAGPTRY